MHQRIQKQLLQQWVKKAKQEAGLWDTGLHLSQRQVQHLQAATGHLTNFQRLRSRLVQPLSFQLWAPLPPPAKHQMLSKIHFRKLLAWQLPAKNSHLPKSLRGRQLRGHQEMYGHSLASSKQLPKCVFLYNANSCAHSPHFLTLLPGSRKPPQFNLQGNYICGLKTAEQRERWYQWDRLIHHSGISSNFHVCKIWRSLSGKWV